MKSINFSLLFMLLLTGARSQCLENGDFATYCGITTQYCPTFDHPCAGGWTRSHGTPQIFPGATPKENVAFMFAAGTGEGLYNSYSFQQNVSYLIRIKMSGSIGPGVTNAKTFLYAANNLQQSPINLCGDPLPPNIPGQVAQQINQYGVGWKEYAFNFVPSANYSQFWMFPVGVNGQFNLFVDYVYVCPGSCNNNTIQEYKSGVVPTSTTPLYGYIYAGSGSLSGGLGITTVSFTGNTELIANKEIILLPEFEAVVTSGDFVAKIIPCDPVFEDVIIDPSTRVATDPVNRFMQKDSMAATMDSSSTILGNREEALTRIKAYPNPANNILKVDVDVQFGLKEIQVVNSAGIVVKTLTNIKRTSHLELDISSLSPGLYYVKCIGIGSSSTKKINIVR